MTYTAIINGQERPINYTYTVVSKEIPVLQENEYRAIPVEREDGRTLWMIECYYINPIH
jgi:hypothetical protein